MKQFKRVQIIMLPKNNKSHIYHIKANNTLGYILGQVESDLEQFPNQTNTQNQHLYIISNDDIKDDKYAVDLQNNKIVTFTDIYRIGRNAKRFKKIIATTDTSLQITKNTSNPALYEYIQQGSVCSTYEDLLPQPSQQFIEKYIECYNKGEVITDVMIEYEDYILNQSKIGLSNIILERLKVNPKDNTITIKSIKDSWNREEVIKLLEEVRWQTIGNPTEFTKNFKNWIEQNL